MNPENINIIIDEISNLKKQQVQLSTKLNSETILSNFETIHEYSKMGRDTLSKEYMLIKQIQRAVNDSLYNNNIEVFVPLFTIVETIRKKLGDQYEMQRQINVKVRNIKAIIDGK